MGAGERLRCRLLRNPFAARDLGDGQVSYIVRNDDSALSRWQPPDRIAKRQGTNEADPYLGRRYIAPRHRASPASNAEDALVRRSPELRDAFVVDRPTEARG